MALLETIVEPNSEPATIEAAELVETELTQEQPPQDSQEQPPPVDLGELPALPEPAQEPAKPIVALPGTCPECGKSGFANDKGLQAHIRFKHVLPRARKLAADKKAAGPTIAPPDFSDIPGASVAPEPAAQLNVVIPDARFDSMANMTFDMTTGLLTRIFGPEWQPTPDHDNPAISHERMTVVESIKKYYQSVDLPDIPPGYMLCFVALAYAAPRMAQQPTKTKLQAGWLWLKMKFQRKPKLAVIK